MKILNLKLVILLEYQNIKTFMQKTMFPIGLKKFLRLKKVKSTEKELQKTNQKEFRVEKVIKRKDDKLYVKWKGYDSSFNSWIDKKDIA